MKISDEAKEAIESGRAVALETSVIAQGLPPPANLEAARRCAAAVRSAGAVPVPIALIAGEIIVGASDAQLEQLADPQRRPAKAGSRDLAALAAAGRDAGTTVSATCLVAARARIRIFATGGIGGVHRRSSFAEPADVSSDLIELSRQRVCVVCAGPKIILDSPATAELLESLGVPVYGYATSELPGFFTDTTGIELEHRFQSVSQVARALRTHWDILGSPSGVLLAVRPPAPLPRAEVEAALAPALREAHDRKLPGKQVTPFLLAALSKATGGRTQTANLALLERNALLAGELACALAPLSQS